MRWADFVLRLFLKPRDRETISGDLLEEYREVVRPDRGPILARLWYLRQVASFVSPLTVGLALGMAAGTLNLVDTAIEPLAEDTAGAMAVWFGMLAFIWFLIGFRAARAQRFRDALVAGVLVGAATMTVFHLAAIIRVNLFLDQIRGRDDWQNLVARFHASGFTSLRAYANYTYISGTPIALALGAAAGAVSGALGGAMSGLLRRSG